MMAASSSPSSDPQLAVYTQELAALLTQSLGTDNALIKQATTQLKSYYGNPRLCVPALVSIAQQHPEPHIRQIAAVECIKRVKKHFLALDDATRANIKMQLLDMILVEQSARTRQSLARVISAVAELLLPISQWPELTTHLYQWSTSSNSQHREIGVFVLYTVFDSVVDAMQDQLDAMLEQLFGLFSKTINDPESYNVRVVTLQALGKIAEFIELDDNRFITAFQSMVPNMVGVLQQALEKSDEDAALKGFEVFDELLYLETPILSKHIGDLIHFTINVASNKNVPAALRVMALNWLMFCVDVKRARISKLKLMPAIVQAVFPIGSEEDTEEADHKADEGDDDEEEGSPSKVAFQVMNIVAVNFPPQQVFPVVMELVTAHAQNPAVGVRKACMLSIAVIVDGCADYMRSKIDGILPFVYAGMQDGTTVVKKSACMALCSLSEELEAEVGQYHAQILPLLFQLMNEGTSQQVLTHATNALDSILESLEEEQLLPYLPSLMEKLVFLLNAPTPDLKATVVSAIGSAAHSAGDKFVPYFPVTIGAMKMLLEMCKTEDEMLLKGVTFDTIGAIAEAVGKEVFRPYMPELMQIAMQALHLNHSRLLECCYCFFSVIARVFEAEFSVYLPHIVPVVLKSCQQPELGEDDAAEEARFAAANLEVGDDAENAGARVRINSSIAEEKETAADSLGSIFAATTTAFLPYVQESTNTLKSLLEHNNDSVRSRARGSLFHFLHTIHKMSNPQEWVAGLPVQVPVHENVVSMNEIVVESVLGMMENEFDKMTMAEAFQDFTEALKTIGPCMVSNNSYKETLWKLIMDVFKNEHPCQDEIIDEDEMTNEDEMSSSANSSSSSSNVEEEDQTEYEAMLVSAAADAVCAFALVLGAQFAEPYSHFHPHIVKHLKPTKNTSEKSMAIGTLSEVSLGLGAAVAPYSDEFMSIFFAGLSDEADEVRSNSAYGLGVLIDKSPKDFTPQFMQILQKLHPLFSVASSLSNIRDNACGAVCRMITKAGHAVPLQSVLPVLLASLPLKKDYDENEPIYECLVSLLETKTELFNLQQIMQLFGQVLAPPKEQLGDKTRKRIVEFLKSLAVHNSAKFQELMAGLTPEMTLVFSSQMQ